MLALGLVTVGVVVLLIMLGRHATPERVAGAPPEVPAPPEAIAAAASGAVVEPVDAGARQIAPSGAETRVRVHVRDEDGIAIEGAVVTLWPRAKELQSRDGKPYARGETDVAGVIALAAVPGTWIIDVQAPDSRGAEFARGWSQRDLQVGELDAWIVMARLDASVCVHVHDDLGTPLEGIGVEARFLGLPERTVKTDARGNAWFEHVPARTNRVHVNEKDLGALGRFAKEDERSFSVKMHRRRLTTVNVATVRGATLVIEAPPAPDGRVPDTGLVVNVRGEHVYRDDSQGVIVHLGQPPKAMSLLPPGRYRVDVTVPPEVDFAEVPLPDLQLVPGETRRLKIPMRPELGRIAGIVLGPRGGPVEGVSVSATAKDAAGQLMPASWKSVRSGRDGRFLIRGMPGGVLVLDVSVENLRAAHFRYVDREDHHYPPGVDDVVIQLRVGHRIRGKLLLDGKPSDEGDVDIRPGRFRTLTDRASIEQAQFTFEHVRPGRHHLTWRIGDRIVSERTVDVPDLPDSTTVEVELSAAR